jgi:phosphohistidine phosphatase
MGQLLLRENLVPDLIISSAAQRARQTALLVAENCGYQKEIAFSQELYIASLDEYLQIIKENSYHEDRVLLVGHNPSVEYLLEKLTRKFETMPAAALAHVSVSVPGWKKLCFDTKAKLANLWRPNEL